MTARETKSTTTEDEITTYVFTNAIGDKNSIAINEQADVQDASMYVQRQYLI